MTARGGRHGDRSAAECGDGPSGVLPRVVLALLLGGSFAGVWLAHWDVTPLTRAFWWLAVLSGGVLAGGLYWRLACFDGDALDGAGGPTVRRRWRRLEAAAVVALGLWGIVALATGVVGFADGPGSLALAVGSLLSPLFWGGVATAGVDGRRRVRSALFLVVLVALAGFAWLETGSGALPWLFRIAHLGAFALWIGGATWHNGVVLPTMRSHPATADALKRQARRFRRHLPVVIPTLLVTGGYQTLGLVGLSPSSLFGSTVGHLIGFKLFVVTVLTALVAVRVGRSTAR